MTREELEKAITHIRFKQICGIELTKREHRILAYGYYAAGCSSCGRR